MSLDYTEKLNQIAERAGMFEFTKFKPLFWTKRSCKKYIAVIDKYFEARKFPIRLILGDAEAIHQIMKMCPALTEKEICKMEDLQNRDLTDYRNCTILVVGKDTLDTLNLERELYNRGPECRVCSIYEYFEYQHIRVRYTFWKKKSFVEKMRSLFKYMMSYKNLNKLLNNLIKHLRPNTDLVIYLPSFLSRETIFCANRAFKSGYLDEEERGILLKKMMGFSVLEKDIIGLKKYIKNYTDEYDKDFRKYAEEVDILLSEMKEKIENRKNKDVIINWVDCISNNRLKKEMPFLYHLSLEKESMKSEYAYTCMPWTTPTMKTIMTGKDPIEGKLYNYKFLNDEMELLREIKKNGYQFLYFGNTFWQEKIIPKKYQGIFMNDMRTPISTEYLWSAVNRIAMEGNKTYFILIHELETHGPYFCPESKELQGGHCPVTEETKLSATAWMDKQYEFYSDIMGNKSLQIYMGDHGNEGYVYENNRINVMFFIRNSAKKVDFSKGMFSLKKVPQLINYLMEWENVTEEQFLDDFIISDSYDYYSEKDVNRIISNNVSLKDKKGWMQVKTIRNQEYAYVLYFDGEEMFFALPNETENLIDRPEYADMIAEMKEKLGTEFIDIYKEEFFVHSRKLHEAYSKLGQN